MSAAAVSLRPGTFEEVVAMARAHPRLLPVGAGTAPVPAAAPAGFATADLRGLSGIVEYEPGEFTFTALAGTPLREIQDRLARHGQHLPFDPPFAERGATLGGAIASGLNGPGRYRFGGVRDFIVGVRLVTGYGELVRGGGKVVKNAAGFDLPKLMVGSLGRLGIIVEATLKVFPRPAAYGSLRFEFPELGAALAAVARLGSAPFDLEAAEIEAPGALALRLGGPAETLEGRLGALERFVGRAAEHLAGEQEAAWWRAYAPAPAAGRVFAKVSVTPKAVPELDRALAAQGAARKYGAAGNVAWVGWPGPAEKLDRLLREQGLAGLVIDGAAPGPLIGVRRGEGFLRRVKSALDPEGRFPDF